MNTRAKLSVGSSGAASARMGSARRAQSGARSSVRARAVQRDGHLHNAASVPASVDVAVACAQALRGGALVDRAVRAHAEAWLRASLDAKLARALGELATRRAREVEVLLDTAGALDATALSLRDEAEGALVALGIGASGCDSFLAEERRVSAVLERIDGKAEARDLSTAGEIDPWVIALASSEADTWWLRASLGTSRLAS